jgi:serine/threonine-protein kinase
MSQSSDMQASPVREGDVLAGKFRVERMLGVGGMGCVVQAMHLELNRRVAVKFMLKSFAGNPDTVVRFLREARAAAGLQSEHVVKVLDVGRLESGEPYMVMEFLAGSDLSALIKSSGKQPVDTAVDYVLQACEALAEAHGQGIVHRDLKPANLFLAKRPDGTALVKVLDFGISKVTRASEPEGFAPDMTSTQAVLGSPAYMSPEQIRSAKNVDARTDIWALGVILYELLCANMIFDVDSLPSLIAAITSDVPVAPRTRRADLPPELEAIMLRCLEKDPARRFQNVAEFALALSPFASSEGALSTKRIVRVLRSAGMTTLESNRPPPAPAAGPPADTQRTAGAFGVTTREQRSSRLAVVGLAVLSLALAVVAGGLWLRSRQKPIDSPAALSPAVSSAPATAEMSPAASAHASATGQRVDTQDAAAPLASAPSSATTKAATTPRAPGHKRPAPKTAPAKTGEEVNLDERL